MVGINGEVGGMIENGAEISWGASLEDGGLNMQTTDKAATTEVFVSTCFKQKPLGQRLGLRGLAYPHKLDEKTRSYRIPLFIDEGEGNLVPQGG
jgi:hypothetical protein